MIRSGADLSTVIFEFCVLFDSYRESKLRPKGQGFGPEGTYSLQGVNHSPNLHGIEPRLVSNLLSWGACDKSWILMAPHRLSWFGGDFGFKSTGATDFNHRRLAGRIDLTENACSISSEDRLPAVPELPPNG
jgi:hypothetical protein